MKNVLFVNSREVKLSRDNLTTFEVLLPKGWQLSDFDKAEDLIEIEDITNGTKFWVNPKELFRQEFDMPIGMKQKVVDLEKGIMIDSWLSHFSERIFRKRYYLLACFLPFNEPERIDRKTIYPKLREIIYDDLFISEKFPFNI